MIRFEYECAGEGCGFASDDMQEALDHCDAGANTLYICANCGKRHGWEINAQACCQEGESELALRAENARLDRIAMDYYERLTGDAQEEIARLQSGIAALRADLINQRDVLVYQFRSLGAYNGAYLQPKMAVIEDVLRALDALVIEEEEQ